MATAKVSHPCGFLSMRGRFPSCVRGDIDHRNDQNNNTIGDKFNDEFGDDDEDDVYGYCSVIETRNKAVKRLQMKVDNNDDLSTSRRILLPHDLYEAVDYCINTSTSPSDQAKETPIKVTENNDVYATVLPKSKRNKKIVDAGKVLTVDNVTANHDADDVNRDMDVPRETRLIDQTKASINESDLISEQEPSYVSMKTKLSSKTRHDDGDNDEIVSSRGPLASLSSNSSNSPRLMSQDSKLSSIPEVSSPDDCNTNFQKCEIDSQIRQKLRREFALLQSVRKSLNETKSKSDKLSPNKTKNETKFQLPPVCGKSPPCFCPEDQLYASKLRIRILKKISTLRKRHLRLRVILFNTMTIVAD